MKILSFLCRATSFIFSASVDLKIHVKAGAGCEPGNALPKDICTQDVQHVSPFPNYHSGICLFENAQLHLFAWLNITSLSDGRNKFVFKSKAHTCMSVLQKKPVCNCLLHTDKYQDKSYNLFFPPVLRCLLKRSVHCVCS